MDKLWWSTIPNARKFVDDIADELKNGRSAIYSINGTLPWSDTFTGILSSEIESSEKVVDIVYAEETDKKTPGEYLFDRYCKPELKMKYRSAMGYDKFLAANDGSTVLINKYIYVKNCSQNAVKQWTEFICKYNSQHMKNSPRCCFIIESLSNYNPNCNITNFQWNDYYHQYDIGMFCLLVSSSIKEKDLIKRYLAELSCSVSYDDVEFAAELVSSGEKLVFDTEKTVRNIVENKCRSDHSFFIPPDNISGCIKEAQIKIFFPMIERFRTQFIDEYIEQLENNLTYTTVYGETVSDCHELELGALKFLCENAKLFVSTEDYKELIFFRECRNKLAHMSLLSETEIRKMSEYKFKKGMIKSKALC